MMNNEEEWDEYQIAIQIPTSIDLAGELAEIGVEVVAMHDVVEEWTTIVDVQTQTATSEQIADLLDSLVRSDEWNYVDESDYAN